MLGHTPTLIYYFSESKSTARYIKRHHKLEIEPNSTFIGQFHVFLHLCNKKASVNGGLDNPS